MMSNNENNIINMPTEPAPRPNTDKTEYTSNNESNKGLLEKARESIHKTVATDEELMQEKPALDRLKASLPSSAKEAVDMAKNTLSTNGTKDGQENSETYTPFENEKGDGHPIEAARSKLYEATKSADVKERQEFENKSLKDRIQHLHEKGSGDQKETNGAELLSSV